MPDTRIKDEPDLVHTGSLTAEIPLFVQGGEKIAKDHTGDSSNEAMPSTKVSTWKDCAEYGRLVKVRTQEKAARSALHTLKKLRQCLEENKECVPGTERWVNIIGKFSICLGCQNLTHREICY